MKELFNRIWKKEQGFSLIELIIVIAILAIIAAIAIPNLIGNINNSRQTSDISNGKVVADAVAVAVAQDPDLTQLFDWTVFADGSAVDTVDAASAVLSDAIPVLQFQTGTYGTTFEVRMLTSGAIEVRSGGGTKVEIFPTPDSAYTD
jgi:prepilin-type N-terminal cleavage/methylation domain-containing protein